MATGTRAKQQEEQMAFIVSILQELSGRQEQQSRRQEQLLQEQNRRQEQLAKEQQERYGEMAHQFQERLGQLTRDLQHSWDQLSTEQRSLDERMLALEGEVQTVRRETLPSMEEIVPLVVAWTRQT